ncbi:hypothetical protein [Frigoriglobus tundricola]|uniref:hypothetical protein n=1 Tax=Frigoriglobus tundricola TaxID=2774151 RepID=UPI001D06AE0E|nr:hypothetical protein [Frigoriglobus tundricola]
MGRAESPVVEGVRHRGADVQLPHPPGNGVRVLEAPGQSRLAEHRLVRPGRPLPVGHVPGADGPFQADGLQPRGQVELAFTPRDAAAELVRPAVAQPGLRPPECRPRLGPGRPLQPPGHVPEVVVRRSLGGLPVGRRGPSSGRTV